MVRQRLAKYLKPTGGGEMLCRDLWHELTRGLKKRGVAQQKQPVLHCYKL